MLFICLWQLLVVINKDPTLISAEKIGKKLLEIIVDEKFHKNLLSTLKITAIGISIAIIFGFSLGIIMSLSDTLRYIFNPLVELFRNVPSITLFPILLVIYGIGDFSRIFVIFWTAYPSILLSTLYGLRTIDKAVIEAAKIEGANEWQIMRYVKIPLAFSEVLNGTKIGIGSGFVAIVVAEMLGASKGLGYMVLWSTNSFKYAETYAYIIIIALVGLLFNSLMSLIIKKYEKEII